MDHYYWIKINEEDDWEPALRVEVNDVIEWYVCSAARPLTPAVIGPRLEAPADGS